ncbi:EthD family reductase [Nocardioides sp. IC4_145]|uniref:EthD family reductase n=1 Tax=Nocardioides sp. IC4_145 TaxID=2714037 RepID=UPI001407D7E7|nr:EthD family reductase [Nocardioides sp. IC4_145]NHC24324.1 EthD family reductase [Nocardioides sp. IC4_145]
MYDVFAIYAQPEDPAAFDSHYVSVHAAKVSAMPNLLAFEWGHVDPTGPGDNASPYLIARMTFADVDAAAEAMASDAGRDAVADLASFAMAGVAVHNVPRGTTPSSSS